MTFLEAALEILRRERKPLHYKDIAQKAIDKKLLTFVGRTPEVTMQTQLTAAVKKAPGNPFVRVKPGTFGLLRYPEAALEPESPPSERESGARAAGAGRTAAGGRSAEGRGRRRGGRGRSRRGGEEPIRAEGRAPVKTGFSEETEADENVGEGLEEPEIGSLSAEARAAALAESGVLSALDEDLDETDDEGGDVAGDDDETLELGEDELESAADEEGQEAEDGDEGDDGEDDAQGEEDEGPTSQGASDDDSDEEDESRGTQAEDEAEERPAAAGEGAEREGGERDVPLAASGSGGFDEASSGRRRRRRRRRRSGGGGAEGLEEVRFESEGGLPLPEGGGGGGEPSEGAGVEEPGPSAGGGEAETSTVRRIMSPVDAAIEILRGQAPGRGMHVRQLADAATRRRLVHGESNEAWRVMRAALAAEPRERLRAGLRPRVRPAGSGLFALSRRPPDLDLERAEHVFGEARRALRERTLAALEQRLTELSPSAFEAIGRVLLQREGFGPATFVKRVEGTIYLEALRGRGARPSRCLIALRPGNTTAGRRAIGELRAGIRARNQDEGVLLLASRLGDDAIAEWKQPGAPVEVADGAARAETCIRQGVGVISAVVSVDFVDADFFAELQEG